MKLPTIPTARGLRRTVQVQFGGINALPGAGDGGLRALENLEPEPSGLLATRPRRVELAITANQRLRNPAGLCVHDGRLYWVERTAGYDATVLRNSDGTLAELEDSYKPRLFCSLGRRLVIFPDKVVYTPPETEGQSGTLEALEASVTQSCTFADGTYAGEPAEKNTIVAADTAYNWETLFKPGDAVRISGSTGGVNDKTIIIREIDGNKLRFYENSFTNDSVAASITVAREVPDLDFVFSHDNRVWGCKGDTIYCSKLGDPCNWNVFDGLASDSWAWESLTGGAFTGACSYLGFPLFFKEDRIFKVYGSKPANFQAMMSPDIGVAKGSGGSLAVAGDMLLYLSPSGFMAYSGGHPQQLGAELGGGPYKNAVAGSDGLRYYAEVYDLQENRYRLVYDTALNAWHGEDRVQNEMEPVEFGLPDAPLLGGPGGDEPTDRYDAALAFVEFSGNLVILEQYVTTDPYDESGGELWAVRRSVRNSSGSELAGTDETPFDWYGEFGDFAFRSPDKKSLARALLRLELEAGATAELLVQYDSDGVWRSVKTIGVTDAEKRSFALPLVPRRCDHFALKLQGHGGCTVHSLALEYIGGSYI